ncbi:MAG: aminomethyl transferase family protein, partial [Rhodoferax sp.]|nr:aminomethyl transferase family protein [Rhodoferax sp.]
LRRSNVFDLIGSEARTIRERVGLVDTSVFSRFEVTGPNAEAWLDRLLAARLPAAGRARLAPMLGHDGRLKGDLTAFHWADGTYWLMGSYYLREFHLRWFADHAMPDAQVRDISDATTGFLLTGPAAGRVLQRCTHQQLDLPFMGCGELDVGMIRARVGRLSIAGELGFEIHCEAAEHATLRQSLLEAGRADGIAEVGYYALNSLRLEKSFGIWSHEFTQGYTPAMTGLDRWIAFDKGDFIGREAALAARQADRHPSTLVTLEIDATDADARGFEPIWHGNRRVGFVTSGGYGYTVRQSLAMAMVDRAFAQPGTALTVHVLGILRAARVVPPSPYDPEGTAMRAAANHGA